jgi:hypothetical protein
MDASTQSIFFALGLYLIYVLLPLVPAILIYRLFPDTKVGATGLLGNLKVNSTGAFAAYIVVVILGYFVIRHIQDLISSSAIEHSAWQVESKVIFKEMNDEGDWRVSERVSNLDVENKLDIRTNPNYNQKNLSGVSFITHSINRLPKITFSFPDYESYIIDLNDPELEIDVTNKIIKLGDIELKKSNQQYNPENFEEDVSRESATVIPFGGPPTLRDSDDGS